MPLYDFLKIIWVPFGLLLSLLVSHVLTLNSQELDSYIRHNIIHDQHPPENAGQQQRVMVFSDTFHIITNLGCDAEE